MLQEIPEVFKKVLFSEYILFIVVVYMEERKTQPCEKSLCMNFQCEKSFSDKNLFCCFLLSVF